MKKDKVADALRSIISQAKRREVEKLLEEDEDEEKRPKRKRPKALELLGKK